MPLSEKIRSTRRVFILCRDCTPPTWTACELKFCKLQQASSLDWKRWKTFYVAYKRKFRNKHVLRREAWIQASDQSALSEYSEFPYQSEKVMWRSFQHSRYTFRSRKFIQQQIEFPQLFDPHILFGIFSTLPIFDHLLPFIYGFFYTVCFWSGQLNVAA